MPRWIGWKKVKDEVLRHLEENHTLEDLALGGKCWVQPTLSHRRLICKNNEGSVVCLDLK